MVPYEAHLSLPERVRTLETQTVRIIEDLNEIKLKLNELVDLKSKGLGAFWFIGLLIGSGLVGLFSNIANLFNKPHL